MRRLQDLPGWFPPATGRSTKCASSSGNSAAEYDVQPIPPKGIEMTRERIRRWTADQIEKALGWLKRMNATGYDIFIRPAAPSPTTADPLVFVDDIDQAT